MELMLDPLVYLQVKLDRGGGPALDSASFTALGLGGSYKDLGPQAQNDVLVTFLPLCYINPSI